MDAQRRKSWMWAEACALVDEAERRHRHFFELLAVPSNTPAWEPPANIYSIGSELQIEIALPGARQADVLVQITAAGLFIETTVSPPSFGPHVKVVRMEIPYGRMRRRIDLPPGRYVLLENRLERGCLYLRLMGSSV